MGFITAGAGTPGITADPVIVKSDPEVASDER
jgi:hypothetical protein